MLDWSPQPFHPAPLAGGRHRQTLLARMLRPDGDVPFRRERWTTPDGDFLDLDFAFPDGSDITTRLVLVLHGLEGSARSRYALETYRQLAGRDVPVVGLNFRSCSGELNRRPRLYHSGETTDLAFVLATLRDRFPDVRLGVVGFSLGGNAMLKYLGETGADAAIDVAAAVSVPFDLSAGADTLARPGGWIYLSYLLRKLQRKTRLKRPMLEDLIDVEAAVRARDFREFDDAATAPLHGFTGAEDYYQRCSSAGFIDRIRVPTLIVHAQDDPFLPAASIPVKAMVGNECVRSVVTERGGHVGFLGGTIRKPRFWAEETVADWLARNLGD